MILTKENFENLLNLVNASDTESKELFASFYDKICIKENIMWLLLLIKLSNHKISHFTENYPEIIKIIPSLDVNLNSVQYLSFDFLTKYTDLEYLSVESIEYLMKEFAKYLTEEVLRKAKYKVNTIDLKLIKY